MQITILDGGGTFVYSINPMHILGAFKDRIFGRYYIDTVNGNQFQVSSESYMRIVDWILNDAGRSR